MHPKEKKAIHIPTGNKVIVYPHSDGGWIDSADCDTRYTIEEIRLI